MTYTPGFAMTVPFELVGTVEVVDLEAACELYSRDMLPYPLGRSRPVGSVWLFTREVGPIDDRLGGGDLRGVRTWVEALVRADVCVECRVSYHDEDTPAIRLHGLRSGESAFVAVQHSDSDGADVVDIYAVSPAVLAAAVADSVGLVGAGSQARIAVGEYDALGFPIPPTAPGSRAAHRVGDGDVVATGTLQSRYAPARHWGGRPRAPDPAMGTGQKRW